MLNLLRKKKIAKRILIVVAAIIIPAFVLWGAGSFGKKEISGVNYVGIINGKKVDIDAFIKARNSMQIQLILNYMGQKEILDKLLGDRVLMNKLTWDSLIMISAAKEKGMKVLDAEVVGFVTSQPLFMNKGAFDPQFYDFIIRQNLRTSTREFEENLRNALLVGKLRDDVLKNVSVSDEEAMDSYRKDFEKAKISYIEIYKDAFEKSISVNEDDINGYYEAHKNEFVAPEKISIEYISFPYQNLTEKDYLVGMVKEAAKGLSKNPGKMDDVAKEYNRVKEETGLFFKQDPPAKFNLPAAAYDKIFKMEKGAIGIFAEESVDGSVYLVKIKDKVSQTQMTKDEVDSIIEAKVKEDKALALVKNKTEEIAKDINSNKLALEDAAAKYGLKLKSTDFINRFEYIEGAGNAYEILDKLFTEKPKAASRPLEVRKGFIIARIDAFQDIDNAKFEEKKEEFKSKVLSIKKNKAMEDWYTEYSKNAKLAIDLRQI